MKSPTERQSGFLSESITDGLKFLGLDRLSTAIFVMVYLLFSNFITSLFGGVKDNHFIVWLCFGTILGLVILLSALRFWFFSPKTNIESTAVLEHLMQDRRKYWTKPVTTLDDLKAAHQITHLVFQSRAPEDGFINDLYGDFSRTLTILLLKKISPREGHPSIADRIGPYPESDVIGYATAWPLTDAAGLLLSSGQLDEESFTHTCFTGSNPQSNYIYIPAIVHKHAREHIILSSISRKDTAISVAILEVAFLDLLLDEFFCDDRPRHLIVDHWSREGKNEASRIAAFGTMELKSSTPNHDYPKELVNVYITRRKDLIRARNVQLRRLAGVQGSFKRFSEFINEDPNS